ncbi:amidohydrolase family protein [Sphingomonas sp. MMS24-JH45]
MTLSRPSIRRLLLATAGFGLAMPASAHEETPARGIPAASSMALRSGAAPARAAGEGAGPLRRLVIRGATLIDGTGSVPRGPVDIVVEGNRIADIRQAGWPGLPLKAGREPQGADQEIDATGMYILPGFVDTHTHLPGTDKAPDASYAYKLWLAHGVTTVRGVPLGAPAFVSSEKRRSAANEIAAPRIFDYNAGRGLVGRAHDQSAESARMGALGGEERHRRDQVLRPRRTTPEVMTAAIDKAHRERSPARRAPEPDGGVETSTASSRVARTSTRSRTSTAT